MFHYVRSGDRNEYVARQKIVTSVNDHDKRIEVDGNLMVEGARFANSNGQVFVFTRSSPSENWTEVAVLTAPEGAVRFGQSVALSQGRLLVGSQKNVYAYTLS